MIVVIGGVSAEIGAGGVVPAGPAIAVARSAVGEGSRVELVTRIGDDPVGDAVVLAIAADGVGHVATLRDPARRTEVVASVEEATDLEETVGDVVAHVDDEPSPALDGADVGLAVRYLSDYRVIVVVHPSDAVLGEAVAAASYAGAHLIVVDDPDAVDGSSPPLPDDTLVLAAEAGAVGVAATIGRYAAAVDQGTEPAAAFAATLGAADATPETV